MADDRKVVVIDGGIGAGAAMAALLAASIHHPQMIVLDREPDYARDLDRMMVTLDVLSMFAQDDRPLDRMGFRHPHPPERAQVAHIDTPKPITKRKARRLRGKGAA